MRSAIDTAFLVLTGIVALLVILIAMNGCAVHMNSDEARFTRDETALDGKADAARTESNFRALLERSNQHEQRLVHLEAAQPTPTPVTKQ